jgi:hypothetical protein
MAYWLELRLTIRGQRLGPHTFLVSVPNPRRWTHKAVIRRVLPVGWIAVPDVAAISLPTLGREELEIEVTAGAHGAAPEWPSMWL